MRENNILTATQTQRRVLEYIKTHVAEEVYFLRFFHPDAIMLSTNKGGKLIFYWDEKAEQVKMFA